MFTTYVHNDFGCSEFPDLTNNSLIPAYAVYVLHAQMELFFDRFREQKLEICFDISIIEVVIVKLAELAILSLPRQSSLSLSLSPAHNLLSELPFVLA